MPIILHNFGARDTVPQTQYPNDIVPSSTSNTAGWIIAAVVGGIILLGAALTYVLVHITKHRQYQRGKRLYPYLTRDDILRRRKLSAVDLFHEEEERRIHMIRKSLATRSTDSAASTLRCSATLDQIDQELMEIERQESLRLKDDWKRWEARMRHQRSLSGDQHPAVSAAGVVPILAIPSPAKHRSQGRIPHLNLNPTQSPAPPPGNLNQHPSS